LVGQNYYLADIGKICDSYSTSAVTGKNGVGGLVGNNESSNSYYNLTISNSYYAGEVTGNWDIGGLVGVNDGTVSSSYYDKEISRQNDTGKGVGKTSVEMEQKSTFAGWDFVKTWAIDSEINNGYPYLRGIEYSEGCGIVNTPIRLPQLANHQISIRTIANIIILKNLPSNAKVQVFDLKGKLISSKSFNPVNHGSDNLQIPVHAKGVYIIKAGKQTFRIAMR
jgi:hypothetical protein